VAVPRLLGVVTVTGTGPTLPIGRYEEVDLRWAYECDGGGAIVELNSYACELLGNLASARLASHVTVSLVKFSP
jgi:hypothetical protein